ncbi:hypothetical protein [uncultured Ruminococcus sp.]|uniref:hypothetical protein n=2 Tax=uncultured Ruminococcus sp. TaxID=165186 RepID=UPI0025CFF744|nr:hypothetical protein [uncultured Ruminococcus sp.]
MLAAAMLTYASLRQNSPDCTAAVSGMVRTAFTRKEPLPQSAAPQTFPDLTLHFLPGKISQHAMQLPTA